MRTSPGQPNLQNPIYWKLLIQTRGSKTKEQNNLGFASILTKIRPLGGNNVSLQIVTQGDSIGTSPAVCKEGFLDFDFHICVSSL